MKFDVATTVTDTIIKMLENGISDGSCQPMWNRAYTMPVNASTKNAYTGVNVLLLWGAFIAEGYTSNYWATFKQWKAMGHNLVDAKGKGKLIVFWKLLEKTETDNSGNESTKKIPYMRYSKVFNADHVPSFTAPSAGDGISHDDLLNNVQSIIDQTGADIRHGQPRASYVPSQDFIRMPSVQSFANRENYYNVMLHELGHWTGHKSRLNRDFSGRFGTESYAFEELIAELTSAFLCAELGITNEVRDDHAKYIKSWVGVLKNDKGAIITAASQASKASAFIQAGASAQTANEPTSDNQRLAA